MGVTPISFAAAPFGPMRHSGCQRIDRHTHSHAFAALVLQGSYLEAGDRGRLRVTSGDVILHEAYESHRNDFDSSGAQVLILPCEPRGDSSPFGRVSDPDKIAIIAESDLREAWSATREQLISTKPRFTDWPDQLASAIERKPSLSITEWSERKGLRLETVSRGFQLAFGVSPKAFRLRSRVLRSLALLHLERSLAEIASCSGFADQAHLTREIRALTGHPPTYWMRQRQAERRDEFRKF